MQTKHATAMCLALVAAISASAANACPANGASYHLLDVPNVSLKLAKPKTPAGLTALEAQLKTPARQLSYSFTASNGYSMTYMVQNGLSESAESDEGSYNFYAFDKKLNLLGLPDDGKQAPAYLFIPDLGPSLYYGSGTREFIPVAMWQLDKCK